MYMYIFATSFNAEIAQLTERVKCRYFGITCGFHSGLCWPAIFFSIFFCEYYEAGFQVLVEITIPYIYHMPVLFYVVAMIARFADTKDMMQNLSIHVYC